MYLGQVQRGQGKGQGQGYSQMIRFLVVACSEPGGRMRVARMWIRPRGVFMEIATEMKIKMKILV